MDIIVVMQELDFLTCSSPSTSSFLLRDI